MVRPATLCAVGSLGSEFTPHCFVTGRGTGNPSVGVATTPQLIWREDYSYRGRVAKARTSHLVPTNNA